MGTLEPEDLAAWVADRAKQDPKVQQVVADVRLLDHLREDAGWQVLHRRIIEQKEGFLHRLATRLMAGREVDQREIDFMRGFYAGAEETAEKPARSAADLEKAAREAYAKGLFEYAETEREGESPYV